MNRFFQVQLMAVILLPGMLELWQSCPTTVLADEPKPSVVQKVRDPMTHEYGVTSVKYSPDGKMLASASLDNTIKLWDIQTGKEKSTLKGHTDSVVSVAFSPDGKTLAS